jgi:hypothetical protein
MMSEMTHRPATDIIKPIRSDGDKEGINDSHTTATNEMLAMHIPITLITRIVSSRHI